MSDSTEGRQASAAVGAPEEPLYVAAFPNDDAYWRIDWIGEVAYPDRYTRRTHPSVLVYLSRVTNSSFQADPLVLLDPNSTDPAKSQTRIWVSVGTLVILRIGDIWHRQTLLMSPDYIRESFEKLSVTRTSTDLIKAGLNPDKSGFLIPISEHPWHMNASKLL